MKMPNFSKMTIEALISARQTIDGLLSTRVAAARKQLLERLHLIDSVSDHGSRGKRRGRKPGRQGKVAPKYRGPSGELWTGRGMKPRWMTAAIKGGARPGDFLIAGGAKRGRKASKSARKRQPNRARRAKSASTGQEAAAA
jgi:DNA-binding protein H-NS